MRLAHHQYDPGTTFVYARNDHTHLGRFTFRYVATAGDALTVTI